jgi:hypothetical protein
MTPTTTTTNPIYSGTEPSSAFADFITRRLRVAGLRAKLALNELSAVGVALKSGLTDGETEMALLQEYSLLDFVTGRSSSPPL